MTIEHKAYLFDHATFTLELEPMLREALTSADCRALGTFIDKHLGELKDPYEGEDLPMDWRSLLESVDPHQVGDIALTKYYDPQGVVPENVES